MLEILFQELIKTSPQLALVGVALFIIYKLSLHWSKQIEVSTNLYLETIKENSKVMGEILEALRRLNGKGEK